MKIGDKSNPCAEDGLNTPLHGPQCCESVSFFKGLGMTKNNYPDPNLR